MRNIMVLALCCLFCGLFAKQTHAADDVYVDLSVLSEIGGGSTHSVYSRQEPRFPVIKNTPQFPVVKKEATKPAKKKVAKKTLPKKVVAKKVSEPKLEQKLKIKQIKVVEEEEKIAVSSKEDDVVLAEKEAEKESVKAEEKSVAEMELKEETVDTEVKNAEPAVVDLSSEQSKREFVADVSSVNSAPYKIEEPLPSEAVSPMPIVSVKTEQVESSLAVEKSVEEEKEVEPLIPVDGELKVKPVSDTEKARREIVFAAGSSELDELSKEKIDAIISSFDNALANKIAIMAYNYDDGQDVFRKKRQSLNRAIAVRSYLLAKGYKNFSIKVINITDNETQGNVVEIDEIK